MAERENTARLYLLGPVQVERNGESVHGFESRKALALLCYLVAQRQPVSRSHLADFFWESKTEERGRANLSRVLHNLSSILPDCLQAERHAVQLRRPSSLWIDTDVFKHLTQAGDLQSQTAAIDLYRGEFMAGFFLDDSPQFETWLVARRESWHHEFQQLLQKLVDGYAQRGEYQQALRYARQAVTLDPWHEEAHRQVMRLLAVTGQRSAALAQYETCRSILAQALDVEPTPETVALYEQIRDGKFSREPRAQEVYLAPSAQASSPFLSTPAPHQKPSPAFVGRQQELTYLAQHLDQVLAGEGQVVFVSGEAGSGKTALVQQFVRRAERAEKKQDLIVVGGNCNAYSGIGDPYLPFRETLDLLTGDIEARWTSGLISPEQAHRLWRLTPHVTQLLVKHSPDLIDVFIPGQALLTRASTVVPDDTIWLSQLRQIVARTKKVDTSASFKQRDLFKQYTKLLQTLAKQIPLLLVLDDLQWADVGSISLLFHLGRYLADSRILVIGIYRESDIILGRDGTRHPLLSVINEFRRRFGKVHVSISEAESKAFAEALLDIEPNRLGPEFRAALYHHTRGNALFTLEVLEQMRNRGDLVKDETGHWCEGESLDWKKLPVRVEGVIGERISRLPAELYETLKIASVAGENFIAEMIARLQKLDDQEMIRRLSRELDQQHHLVQAQGRQRLSPAGPRLSNYRFRHNLFQKYLYDSLDEVERAFLHEVVGETLEQMYAGHTEAIAGQLALHFETAGLTGKAIQYLSVAGERAVKVYAYEEAIDNFKEAINLVDAAPGIPDRDYQKLVLYLALERPLVMTKGYAAAEVEQTYREAYKLSQAVEDVSLALPVMRGLWNCHLVRAEHHRARELSSQLLALAKQSQDPIALMEAHWVMAETFFSLGKLETALSHETEAIERYDQAQYQAYPYRAVQNPGLTCRYFKAVTLWLRGYPDQALVQIEETLSQARALDHPFDVTGSLYFKALLHQFRRETAAVETEAKAAVSLAQKQGFTLLQANVTILEGWALSKQEQADQGLVKLLQGLAALQEMQARVWQPYFLGLIAEIYQQQGQSGKAQAALDEALKMVKKSGEKWWVAELHRLRGEVLITHQAAGTVIEQAFDQAVSTAQQQGAKSLELRAVMSLARWWHNRGKAADAYQKLSKIYAWFREGFDTPDLQAARRLLSLLEEGGD